MSQKQLKIFQFWNTPTPPAEVAALIASWQNDTNYIHTLFTAETADQYIEEHFDARTLAAYRTCAVPAMQADFFRYCVLYQEGGVYIDADTLNGGNLEDLVSQVDRGMLMNRQTKVANDFMFFRYANDTLLKQVIEQATLNVEGKISNNVWLVTGPGIMTHMYQDLAQRKKFDGIDICDVRVVREVVHFKNNLEYKNSDSDWRQNIADDAPSIFRDI